MAEQLDYLVRWLNLTSAEQAALRLDGYTADDWEGDTDWKRMICAAAKAGRLRPTRWLWMFACAITRQSWAVQSEARRRAIIYGEAAADSGVRVDAELASAVHARANADLPDEVVTEHMTFDQAHLRLATFCCHHPTYEDAGLDRAFSIFELRAGIDAALCPGYLRDLLPNPFLPPPAFDEEWLYADSAAVLLLAQEILYDYRYDRTPELAAALERAGCRDERILSHLRHPGPHYRGCWAVDGLLRPDADPLQRLLRRPPVPGDRLAAYLLSDPKDPFTLYRG